MKSSLRATAVLLGVVFATGPALSQELYIYPAKGQTNDQMEKDKYECYSWAKNDTGFDPMAVPTTTTAPSSGQKQSGGVVRGGLGGAALGAIIGDSSKAAKRGAVAGGLIGGVRQSTRNQETERNQQEWAHQESANYSSNRNNYNRAYSACLEGRGYTVK